MDTGFVPLARAETFTNRRYGQLKITASQWLWLIKLFELEISSHRIAQGLRINYPTALRATSLIRQAIFSKSKDL